MSEQMIAIEGVGKRFSAGDSEFWALRDINLSAQMGETIALSGPSGSGKSTLLSILGSLLHPDSGSVHIAGHDLSKMNSRQCDRFRWMHFGIIFQRFNLIPVLTALENVEMALVPSKLSAKEKRSAAQHWLDRVGLSHRTHTRASLLSGGEQQRVAIARALVHEPKIVIADEPTANLDRANAVRFLDTLLEINASTKTTLIVATHDPMALNYFSRVVRMEDGLCIA